MLYRFAYLVLKSICKKKWPPPNKFKQNEPNFSLNLHKLIMGYPFFFYKCWWISHNMPCFVHKGGSPNLSWLCFLWFSPLFGKIIYLTLFLMKLAKTKSSKCPYEDHLLSHFGYIGRISPNETDLVPWSCKRNFWFHQEL